MAKGRMVNREIGSNERFCHMSKDAQLFYFFVLPYLDWDGLVKGHPAVLSGMATPLHSDLRDKAAGLIGEWIAHGFAIRYEWTDGSVLFFPEFRKDNQHLKYEREQPSEFPPPPGYHRSKLGLIPDDAELAGRQAERYDPRSKYHEALTEADTGEDGESQDDLRSKLGGGAEDIRIRSGGDPDLIRTKGIEVEVEEINGREENTTTRALVKFALPLMLLEWNGGGAYLESLNDEELLIVSSWLWLWKKLKRKSKYSLKAAEEVYRPDPFSGIENPVGFIRVKVKEHAPAPLHVKHRASLMQNLENLKEKFYRDAWREHHRYLQRCPLCPLSGLSCYALQRLSYD